MIAQLGYVTYTNVDGGFVRPYEHGDRLVRGYPGEIDVDPADLAAAAEAVFVRHNRDDRPDGLTAPSLSVGDVVVFGEVALSVAGVGFVRVALDPDDLITDRSWREVLAEPAAPVASTSAAQILDMWSSGPPAGSGIEL
jgi:hypothetical protein